MSNQGKGHADARPQTPPSNTETQAARAKQNSLTPRNPKDSGGSKAQHQLRSAIAESMRDEILHCPLEEYLNHYAPFAPSSEYVEKAYEQVKSKCLQKFPRNPPGEDGLSWAGFDGDSPSEIDGPEARVFAHLAEILQVLEDLDPPSTSRQLNFRYRDAPYAKVKGEIPGSTFKMDACIQPCEAVANNVVCPADTAVVAEFKKEAKPRNIQDNRLKVVCAASHIMNDDPRRKWMYGITVENEKMSLWYFSRSHSVKSYEFDFTREFRIFIRVFVSFLFAKEEEMGFDPTVRRVEIEGKYRYIYQIRGKYFLTQRTIFNPRVLCISGRKTRVWSVVEVGGNSVKGLKDVHHNGKEFALKDVWLDRDSLTEGEILTLIFDRLDSVEVKQEEMPDELYKQLKDALNNQQYKRYFMNIVCHDKGDCSKSVAEGARPDPQILNLTIPDMTDEELKSNTLKGSTQTIATSNLSGRMRPSNMPQVRDYKTKQQYRLVYDDVGIPLHASPDLASSFQAIYDTFIALFLMYLAGWAHRDVSTGNIILVKQNCGKFIGKLSDLEYAKIFSTQSIGNNDPKTGTPYFMPWEVHSSQRLHRKTATISPEVLDNHSKPIQPRLSRQIARRWPWFYRFDYDLESVWWVILWGVLSPVPHMPARELSRRVFTYSTRPSDTRTDIFTDEDQTSIPDAMHPRLAILVPSIEDIHRILYASYERIPEGQKGYMTIYVRFWQQLHPMLSLVQSIGDFRLIDPDSEIPPSQAQEKRQREDAHDTSNGGGNSNVDGEISQKRQRVQPDRAAKNRTGHPGQFNHRIYTPF